MKKFFTLMLCGIMAFSVTACGSSADKTETNSSSDEIVTSSESAGAAFDTSWTDNEFEAMVPELPFKGWTVINETDTVYELELGGLSTANGADTATGFEKDKDDLISYINTLPTYGFTVEEQGENYKWLVTDKDGNTAEFICGDGYCWITFTKAN